MNEFHYPFYSIVYNFCVILEKETKITHSSKRKCALHLCIIKSESSLFCRCYACYSQAFKIVMVNWPFLILLNSEIKIFALVSPYLFIKDWISELFDQLYHTMLWYLTIFKTKHSDKTPDLLEILWTLQNQMELM